MPAHILIVEDNPANLELMAYLLDAYGHAVKRAGGAQAGLSALENERFDLVLADILMPGMDGYEFVRRARTGGFGEIPIVAVTALAMVGDRERTLAAGFDGYIAKPINPETFVHEVGRFLSEPLRSSGTRPHRPAPASEGQAAAPTGRTILVVDDVPTNAQVIRAAIEPFGHEVIEVHSMDEALTAARARRLDLILTDVHMPDGTGLDLIRAFKNDPALAAIPFIFLSSTYWHDLDKARGLSLGAKKFLLRPIEPRALVDEINATLEGSDM